LKLTSQTTDRIRSYQKIARFISYLQPLWQKHTIKLTIRQWLRIREDIPVAYWLRIPADNFYLFNDLSARIVRTSVCHRRSCGTSTRICSLTREMATNTGRHTYLLPICSTRAKDKRRRTKVRLPVSVALVLQIWANKGS